MAEHVPLGQHRDEDDERDVECRRAAQSPHARHVQTVSTDSPHAHQPQGGSDSSSRTNRFDLTGADRRFPPTYLGPVALNPNKEDAVKKLDAKQLPMTAAAISM